MLHTGYPRSTSHPLSPYPMVHSCMKCCDHRHVNHRVVRPGGRWTMRAHSHSGSESMWTGLSWVWFGCRGKLNHNKPITVDSSIFTGCLQDLNKLQTSGEAPHQRIKSSAWNVSEVLWCAETQSCRKIPTQDLSLPELSYGESFAKILLDQGEHISHPKHKILPLKQSVNLSQSSSFS